jgi:hypothetical protein
MNEIESYSKSLKIKAKNYLKERYKFDSIKISPFQYINFYLIDKAVRSSQNLFINSFEKNISSLSQFPALLSLAISTFYKNYRENDVLFKKGDIVQKDKLKYKILRVTKNAYFIGSGYNGRETIRQVSKDKFQGYSVVTSGLSTRKVKVGLSEFRRFYKMVFKANNNLPTKFSHKSAIILSKKELENEIKEQKYLDIDIKKAIPMSWIASSGKISWQQLPIDTMIYCVPDFETLQEHVLDKGIKIQTVVVIGNNKYKDEHGTNIKRAIRERAINNCVILGSEDIQDKTGQFLKWNWTYPEFAYLRRQRQGEITIETIEDQAFEQALINFIDALSKLEELCGIALNNIKGLRKFLYALVLAKQENSRNLTQLEYIKHLLSKVTNETIYEEFYSQNLEPYEVLDEISPLIQNIFDSFNNKKLQFIEQLNFIDVLIVPEKMVDNWKEEFKTKVGTICYFKEFMNSQNKFNHSITVYVLSLFGNGMNQRELIEIASNTKHDFKFLAYPEEAEIIELFKINRKNNLLTEYQSDDRKKISKIIFNIPVEKVKITKSLGEIMDELYDKQDKKSNDYEYDSQTQVNYELYFDDQPFPLIIDGSKTVLILKKNNWIKTKTYNLLAGDTVRIYNNLSKEILFEIAAGEDNNGRFAEIVELSQLWKRELRCYFSANVSKIKYYDTSDLLESLKSKGATITNAITINKWLDSADKERFPNDSKNLIAIKNLINSEVLNKHFDKIIKVRSFYRGVMISLGRDLSDDVMEFVQTNGQFKGHILSKFNAEEIQSFVHNAAPIKKIKSINITEDEESNG